MKRMDHEMKPYFWVIKNEDGFFITIGLFIFAIETSNWSYFDLRLEIPQNGWALYFKWLKSKLTISFLR